ncbi:hypothetical protein bcgnr5373_11450 [Bacillus cereus]
MIQFIDLFDKQINEFVEILYLTEKPVVLSEEKYEKYIGVVPRTSYYEGGLYISKKTSFYLQFRSLPCYCLST